MDGHHASHRLRRGRASEAGRAYHVRFSILPGSAPLHDLATARHVVRGLMATQRQARTLCFVVMPDHVHWLLRLEDGASLSTVVQKARSLGTRSIRREPGRQHFTWQPGFFDRAIRRDEDLTTAARYIVANPLRAGLVKDLRDYPHWDAIWLG
ncbi:transposase [Guyparkeria sp. 1SP6A2]|nr:transposase [Guyparkeria sp. 1SP6A2]